MKTTDLISKEELNNYMKIFSSGFNTIAVVTEIDGTPITNYNYFTEICDKYHRKHEISAKKCMASDRKLGLKAAAGKEIIINACGCGGLMDACIPIIINNKHIANIITGQVLFKEPDLGEFRKLAKEFKIEDINGYLESVKKVRVISKEELLKIANSLKIYTEMIFNSAYEKYKNKELAEYYSNLLYELPIATNLYTLDGKRIEVSKATAEMFGYSANELKNDDIFYSNYSEEDAKEIKDAFELAKNGQDASAEVTAYRKDKSTFQIIINYAPIKNKNGEIVNIIGTGTDVSDIKNLQEYYKSIFYYSPIPTSLDTIDGKRLDFSLLAEKLYGYQKEEILNLPIEKLYKEDDAFLIKNAFKTANTGRSAAIETVANRKDGTTFPVLLNLFPVKNKNGEIINILVSGTDLTEIKQRENEYQRAIEEITKTIEYISMNDFDTHIFTDYKSDDLQLMTGAFNEILKYLKKSDEDLNNLIKDLATPAIEVMKGVIVMPLIGKLTSDRALDDMDNILKKIAETDAFAAILDITGVSTIDSAVADSIIKTMESIKLIGATPILCGISPEIVSNMVKTGIRFEFITKRNLSEALKYLQKSKI